MNCLFVCRSESYDVRGAVLKLDHQHLEDSLHNFIHFVLDVTNIKYARFDDIVLDFYAGVESTGNSWSDHCFQFPMCCSRCVPIVAHRHLLYELKLLLCQSCHASIFRTFLESVTTKP